MTKSISAILQESLCSEENFSEEAEYESAMVTNLQVHVRIKLIMCKDFQLVYALVVLELMLYSIMPKQIRYSFQFSHMAF